MKDGPYCKRATTPEYTVAADVTVRIAIHNQDVIERVTGPKGDEWRSQFYRLSSLEDVLGHLAFNAVLNGVEDVSRLDGWADLDASAVTITVERDTDWEVLTYAE